MNNTMDILTNVDFVPQGMPSHSGRAVLVIFEDNDAVIKMTIKGRSPTMRHLARVGASHVLRYRCFQKQQHILYFAKQKRRPK